MSEPPENPRPAGGDWQSPDPQVPDSQESDAPAPEATPERPPPYQGTYGAQPGATPPAPAPPGPAAGYGQPGQPGQASQPGQPGQPPPGYALPSYPQTGYGQPGYAPPGPPYPGHGGPHDMLASRWARLGAGILDTLILSIVAVPAVLFSIRWDKLEESMSSSRPITDPMDIYNVPRLVAGYAIAFLVGFVYYTVLHAKWGQTVGKKAVGIRLVKASDQSAVSWGQAIGRQAFVYFVTVTTSALNLLAGAAGILGILGLLDNAWILWDQRRQALHDKVAGTLVVKTAPWIPNPYARPPAPEDPGNT